MSFLNRSEEATVQLAVSRHDDRRRCAVLRSDAVDGRQSKWYHSVPPCDFCADTGDIIGRCDVVSGLKPNAVLSLPVELIDSAS